MPQRNKPLGVPHHPNLFYTVHYRPHTQRNHQFASYSPDTESYTHPPHTHRHHQAEKELSLRLPERDLYI